MAGKLVVSVYTDGAFRRHDNRGGCAFVVHRGERLIFASGKSYMNTTSNRMEVRAAIHALDWCIRYMPQFEIALYTDSRYLCSLTEWVPLWQANGWVTRAGSPVANTDLIFLYWRMFHQANRVTVQWVRGHSGNPGNEHANRLAEQFAAHPQLLKDDLGGAGDLAEAAQAWMFGVA